MARVSAHARVTSGVEALGIVEAGAPTQTKLYRQFFVFARRRRRVRGETRGRKKRPAANTTARRGFPSRRACARGARLGATHAARGWRVRAAGGMAPAAAPDPQQLLLARVQSLDSAHALEVCGWLLGQVRARAHLPAYRAAGWHTRAARGGRARRTGRRQSAPVVWFPRTQGFSPAEAPARARPPHAARRVGPAATPGGLAVHARGGGAPWRAARAPCAPCRATTCPARPAPVLTCRLLPAPPSARRAPHPRRTARPRRATWRAARACCARR
jgi:hypothetical protein